MHTEFVFSTSDTAQTGRADAWNRVIAESYFPLDLSFRDKQRFNGRLERATLGHVGFSRLTSQPASYERRATHLCNAREEEYLVTLPRSAPVEFRQLGRDVRCDPGGFIIERGDEPYRFRYEKPNDLFVLKVSRKALSERVRDPDRFCARVIDATSGSAALFASMVAHVHARLPELGASAGELLGRQMLELLGLALDDAGGPTDNGASVVRAAHLTRVERFIRANLKHPDLSPGFIAAGCGISTRYLHDLFRDVNGTVSQHIRDQRLIAARDRLAASGSVRIADVAYRFGFSDQAQFSRLFKARFGVTPSDFQRQPAMRHPT
ncbi:MAG: DNA-binding protein [Rhodobacteraceae bacterium]|nr:MAG: DNA-binding protein [Paracoccaceae bacterium]